MRRDERAVPAGYWILIITICIVVVVLKRSYNKAHDRAADLESNKDRIKGEFRSQDGQLREYQNMCHDLMTTNEELRTAIAQQDLTPEQRKTLDAVGKSRAEGSEQAAHLKLVSSMRYPEGRQYKDQFVLGSFVSDLKVQSRQDAIEATLLCIDSGIIMRFLVDYDPILWTPFLSVILQIPEGGTCCIFKEGESNAEEDWPPVRACVDTMFAHDKEVYLTYRIPSAQEATA